MWDASWSHGRRRRWSQCATRTPRPRRGRHRPARLCRQVCTAWRDLVACPTAHPFLHSHVLIDGRPSGDDGAADGARAAGRPRALDPARLAAWLAPRARAIRSLEAADVRLPAAGWLPVLGRLAGLAALTLGGDTARGLPWAALPPGLRALAVVDCEGSLTEGDHLAHLPRGLTSLALAAARAPDGGLVRSGRPFLDGFSPSLLALTGLRDLALASRGVRALPDGISALTALTRLSVRHAGLVTLPPSLSSLTRLQELDLAGNKLLRGRGARRAVAPLAALARSLRRLDLSANGSRADETELPGCVLGALTGLVELRAAHNARLRVPASLSSLSRLALLDLTACDLAHYPPALADLRGVATLLLGGNRRVAAGGLPSSAALDQLLCPSPPAPSSPAAPSPSTSPATGDGWPKAGAGSGSEAGSPPLRGLALPPPRSPALPPASFSQLVRVRVLDLSRAGLVALPPGATALTSLVELTIRGASAYPGAGFAWDSLAHVPTVRALDISESHLDELPSALAALPRLRALVADDCSLARLGACPPGLTSLSANGNRLAWLPAGELAAVPRLERASLRDNLAMQLPADLALLGALPSLSILDARKVARGVGGGAPWSARSMWALARAHAALARAAPGRDWSSVLLL